METNIGQHFRSFPAQRAAVLPGIGTVVVDFLRSAVYPNDDVRMALALISFALLLSLTSGNLATIGLPWTPKQV